MLDQYDRKIEYVRISLTDRCNLRCRYCMPEEGVAKLTHADILTFDEVVRIARALAALGVKKIRLTGGEPLVRRGITDLVGELKAIPGIEQVVMTTNAVLLSELLPGLVAAGLDGLNISLDTLNPATFATIARRDLFDRVMAGLAAVRASGITNVKYNCVPIYDVNDAEIPRIVELARADAVKVRFIELMPIGCAYEVGYRGVPMADVRARLEREYGELTEVPRTGAQVLNGPAAYYRIAGFLGEVGFIDAIEHKFCASCNRVRLTAEGFLKLCLNASAGLDLRALVRSGVGDDELTARIAQTIYRKPAEHLFFERDKATRDVRAMYQVGG